VEGRLGLRGWRIAHVVTRELGLLDGANPIRSLIWRRLRHAGELGLGDLVLIGEAGRQRTSKRNEQEQAKPSHATPLSKKRSTAASAPRLAVATENPQKPRMVRSDRSRTMVLAAAFRP
jgi:hypothetical protein